MPRPRSPRTVRCLPHARVFKPRGIPTRDLEWVSLGLDELEAIRLADHEGLYHEQAAEAMGVSRTTFARILAGARRKVAGALLDGKALAINDPGHHDPGREDDR